MVVFDLQTKATMFLMHGGGDLKGTCSITLCFDLLIIAEETVIIYISIPVCTFVPVPLRLSVGLKLAYVNNL